MPAIKPVNICGRRNMTNRKSIKGIFNFGCFFPRLFMKDDRNIEVDIG